MLDAHICTLYTMLNAKGEGAAGSPVVKCRISSTSCHGLGLPRRCSRRAVHGMIMTISISIVLVVLLLLLLLVATYRYSILLVATSH